MSATRTTLLLACVELAAERGGSGATWSLSDLVLRAWALAPDLFGLPEHERTHPSSQRVACRLSTRDGVVGVGWVERVDSPRGHLRLTHAGMREARRAFGVSHADLVAGATDGAPLRELLLARRRRTLDAATRTALDRMAACGVLQKAQRGVRLTEADARTLWGATPCTSRADLLALAADTHACLRRVMTSGTDDDARRAAAVLIVHHQLARLVALGGP